MSDTDYELTPPCSILLPSGVTISKPGPVVIIGPNGSGKSRRSKEITSDGRIEVISALRNTRISQQLQPMALQQARQNFEAQKDAARNQPYEYTNDFDYMLTALVGEAAEVSLDYLTDARNSSARELPPLTVLERIQYLWKKFFPGRELKFRNYMPQVTNTVAVGDEPKVYSAWQMSDGEKAALYLAGRALAADPGIVLLVDEPETHFHSLLAVQFWNEIEMSRPDLRFIYATHDMTFAASRSKAHYLLANPTNGLQSITLSSNASDLSAVLLGTASLSFYASRIIFCEGDVDSLDARLYSAWFNDKNDIVQPVGSCEMVIRSVMALASSSIVSNLTVNGIIDRDFRSAVNLVSLPAKVFPLGVHEVETLFSLPDVVEAVTSHIKKPFDKKYYEQQIISAYTDSDRHVAILERWKRRVDSALKEIITGIGVKDDTIENLIRSLPDMFAQEAWNFSPVKILEEEKGMVEANFNPSSPNILEILRIMPGKKLRQISLHASGLQRAAYDNLVIKALEGSEPELESLTRRLRGALRTHLEL
ncbi:AAA family ATPase [Nocardia salmonicida]|uniref:AAA family ATPase n=1 Tax=Nocardia salmonicida TaxID=53431 RepID=UPI0037900A3E